MTTQQAIHELEANIRIREALLNVAGNTFVTSIERDIEFNKVCLEALRGWEAVNSLLSNPEIRCISFSKFDDMVQFNASCRRGFSGNGILKHKLADTACQAAIAAAEKVGGE